MCFMAPSLHNDTIIFICATLCCIVCCHAQCNPAFASDMVAPASAAGARGRALPPRTVMAS